MGDKVFDGAEQLQASEGDRSAELRRFADIRRESEALTANLTAEDQAIQSMPDVSPTKWHLAHTTWFFETFILTRFDADYRVFDPAFAYLFNSYYEAVGPRHPRPERGLLSRPTVDIVASRSVQGDGFFGFFFQPNPAPQPGNPRRRGGQPYYPAQQGWPGQQGW